MKNLKYLIFMFLAFFIFNFNVNADYVVPDDLIDIDGYVNNTKIYSNYTSLNTYKSVAVGVQVGVSLNIRILGDALDAELFNPKGVSYYVMTNICTTEESAFHGWITGGDDVYGDFIKSADVQNRRDTNCKVSGYNGMLVTRTIEVTVTKTTYNVDGDFYEAYGQVNIWGGTGNLPTYNNFIKIESVYVYRSTNKSFGEAQIVSAIEDTNDTNEGILSGILNLPSDIWNKMSSSFSSMISYLSNLPSDIWNWIKTGFNWIVGGLEDVGDFIVALPSGIWNAIKGGFNGIVDVLDGLYHWIFKVDYEIPTDVTSDGLIGSGIGGGTGFVKGQIGWFPAGPVDNIINLPFTFLNNINTNLSNQCTPANLPLPYVDKNLPLPCVNSIYSNIGTGLTTWIQTISVLISGLILYRYFLSLYKWVDNTLTFRENNHLDNWGGL